MNNKQKRSKKHRYTRAKKYNTQFPRAAKIIYPFATATAFFANGGTPPPCHSVVLHNILNSQFSFSLSLTWPNWRRRRRGGGGPMDGRLNNNHRRRPMAHKTRNFIIIVVVKERQ
jgi:hypothetical protein